jgi:phage baseplate assembly protein gpV
VVYSSSSTGEIKVRIPTVTGPDSSVPVSTIGRTAYNGTWTVPQIGEQIVVTADDGNLTNVFWVQVNPSEPVSLTPVETDISDLQADVVTLQADVGTLQTDVGTLQTDVNTAESDISALQAAVTELQSYKDALLLGIFR